MEIRKIEKNKILVGIYLAKAIIDKKEEITLTYNPKGLGFNFKDAQYFVSYETIIQEVIAYHEKLKEVQMSNGFTRKIVKCGKCGEPKLLLYDKGLEKVRFICKCGAINEYLSGTENTGKIITKEDL